jgi:hypothetical protein
MTSQLKTKKKPSAFSETVQKELKNEADDKELQLLQNNRTKWRSELLNNKHACENQFVAQRARLFENHRLYTLNLITQDVYLQVISQEKAWKCNAVRFLQQIESKLREINTSADA